MTHFWHSHPSLIGQMQKYSEGDVAKGRTKEDAARDCAAAWFLEMERAVERGDLGRAAEARRQLQRLGYEVFARGKTREGAKNRG